MYLLQTHPIRLIIHLDTGGGEFLKSGEDFLDGFLVEMLGVGNVLGKLGNLGVVSCAHIEIILLAKLIQQHSFLYLQQFAIVGVLGVDSGEMPDVADA